MLLLLRTTTACLALSHPFATVCFASAFACASAPVRATATAREAGSCNERFSDVHALKTEEMVVGMLVDRALALTPQSHGNNCQPKKKKRLSPCPDAQLIPLHCSHSLQEHMLLCCPKRAFKPTPRTFQIRETNAKHCQCMQVSLVLSAT